MLTSLPAPRRTKVFLDGKPISCARLEIFAAAADKQWSASVRYFDRSRGQKVFTVADEVSECATLNYMKTLENGETVIELISKPKE
jgi:hypothetical protein